MPEWSVSRNLRNWFKTEAFTQVGKNMALRMTCERSKELNAVSMLTGVFFRDGDQRPEREKESAQEASARWWNERDLQCFAE
jgi:hypothetical protein